MTNETINTLAADAEGWLIDKSGDRIFEIVPMPLFGACSTQVISSESEAATRLHKRIVQGGVDMSDLHYDFIAAPDGERYYTARMGRPVNEPQPRTLVDEVMGL